MSHVCPLCHERLACDAPEAASGWDYFNQVAESMCRSGNASGPGAVAAQPWPVADMASGGKLNGLAAGPPAAAAKPRYRVVWGKNGVPASPRTFTWRGLLVDLRMRRELFSELDGIRVVAVPQSPTHPAEGGAA